MVSNHVSSGAGRDIGIEGSGASRDGHTHFPGTQGTSDSSRYAVGQRVTITVGFASGSYHGEARIVQLDPLRVEFVFKRKKKRLCIAESDIV